MAYSRISAITILPIGAVEIEIGRDFEGQLLNLMLITYWTWALVSLFKWQYSYNVPHQPIDVKYINVTQEHFLRSCIYATDRSFKKGSSTLPRAELRSIYEANGTLPYKFEVDIKSVPNGTDYSVWQIFGDGSPLLMVRHRNGQKQLVVFDGTPKIQTLGGFPRTCTLDCTKGKVKCGETVSTGQFKCGKLYFKLGVYAQGQKPRNTMCVEYGRVNYFALDYT